jgi:hypothetical protein
VLEKVLVQTETQKTRKATPSQVKGDVCKQANHLYRIEYMEISEDDERESFQVRRNHIRLAFAQYSYRIFLGYTTWCGAQLC